MGLQRLDGSGHPANRKGFSKSPLRNRPVTPAVIELFDVRTMKLLMRVNVPDGAGVSYALPQGIHFAQPNVMQRVTHSDGRIEEIHFGERPALLRWASGAGVAQ